MAVEGPWKKALFKFKIKKVESSDDDLACHVFSVEDVAAHLAISGPSEILISEKWAR